MARAGVCCCSSTKLYPLSVSLCPFFPTKTTSREVRDDDFLISRRLFLVLVRRYRLLFVHFRRRLCLFSSSFVDVCFLSSPSSFRPRSSLTSLLFRPLSFQTWLFSSSCVDAFVSFSSSLVSSFVDVCFFSSSFIDFCLFSSSFVDEGCNVFVLAR